MVNPVIASIPFFDTVKSIPNFTVSVQPSLEFQHFDFNQAYPYLALLASVRHAIAYGTNRAGDDRAGSWRRPSRPSIRPTCPRPSC